DVRLALRYRRPAGLAAVRRRTAPVAREHPRRDRACRAAGRGGPGGRLPRVLAQATRGSEGLLAPDSGPRRGVRPYRRPRTGRARCRRIRCVTRLGGAGRVGGWAGGLVPRERRAWRVGARTAHARAREGAGPARGVGADLAAVADGSRMPELREAPAGRGIQTAGGPGG